MPTIADINSARDRLRRYLHPTLMEIAPGLGKDTWLKLENTNLTHSFKIRGALNAVLSLDDEQRARGIITVSSGNHAQGIAYAAYLTGATARILMPSSTPKRKVDGVKRFGAIPILDYDNYDEAELVVHDVAREGGYTFVSPYNDPNVVAGAGTIGLEIVDSLPDVGRVIVPTSGGGLISGIALAVKSLKPDAEVIGVNILSAPAMYNIFEGTNLPHNWDTLAEALSGDIEKGSITIEMAQKYVDKIVLVTEEQVADAIRWMVDQQGWMVEGGATVGVAALLNNVVPADDRKTAVVISGGNIDGKTFREVLGK
jgi:threonine dehydratase